ncbi:MAG: MoaD/ThiS family protein [Crenarchaeota archaeon]|nr:MoaD/ThiS family protein [Thermoproteota archaeon]
MKVKVKFFAELREIFGKEAEFECSCATPEELLEELFKKFEGLKEKAEEYGELGLVVLVNGRDVRHLKELRGDEITVSVFPPAAGG